MILLKGHAFEGPDGMGYRLKVDVETGDALVASQFEAYGGAPEPVDGTVMPTWLELAIRDELQSLYRLHRNRLIDG